MPSGSGKTFTEDDYAYIGRMMADAYEHARRRVAAAADCGKRESQTGPRSCAARLLALAARWRGNAHAIMATVKASKERGSTATFQVSYEKAQTLLICADEAEAEGRAAKANVRISDGANVE